MKPLLAVIVLAKNEEQNIARCLSSIASLNPDVCVVDSGSTDRTVEVAKSYGARVLQHAWKNYSSQMNWAIDNLDTNAEWVLRLDADEYLTPELARELSEKLPEIDSRYVGLFVKRRFVFLGRWMRHGGMYPLWHLRIWRKSMARCEDRWMDEHMQLSGGDTLRLDHDLVDENNKDLTFWVEKHNHYANRELLDLASMETSPGTHVSLMGQAARKRWIKESLYSKSPLLIRAFVYGCFRYFIQLGLLDGKEGLIFHFLHAFWYRFLVDSKIIEKKILASLPAENGIEMLGASGGAPLS